MRSVAKKCILFVATLVMVAATAQLPLLGQFSSQIEGTITDPTRAVIPSASLTLRNVATGIEMTVQSSAAGYFRFPSLPSATFRLIATASGFKTTEISDLRLEVGETRTVNISLEVGAAASAVTVAADASAVELSEARVSSVVESRQFQELPLLGRNMFGLVALTPGVTGTTGLGDVFGSERDIPVNAGGMRSEQNVFSVDSGSVTSMVRRGRANLQPNSESIQEMRVSVNNYAAAHGNDAGASVNVITKSGSNDFHGAANWFHWNNKLQSRNIFQRSLPKFRRNEGAASFGGPIIKNRTFFFGSYSLIRQGTASGGTAVVETPELVNYVSSRFANNKSATLLKNFKPFASPDINLRTAGQYAGVTCASATQEITTPIGPMPCGMPLTGEGVTGYTTPRSGYQWNTRVDHMFSDKDRFYFNGYRNAEKGRLGSTTRPDFNTYFPIWNWYGNVNWTRTISSTLTNEARFNVVRVHGEISCGEFCDLPSGIGVAGAMTGWGTGGPTPFIQNNYHWSDQVSWVKGKHTLKFGGAISKLQSNWKPTASYQRPNFNFNNIFDFVLDQPFSQGNIGLNPVDGTVYTPDVAEREQVLNAFIDDSWKIRPNLTVTFGLRWETNGKIGQATLGNNVEWLSGNDFRSRIADGKNVTSFYILSKGDYNNFAPRLSLAWDPTGRGKTSIRAGGGVFYDFMPSQLYGGAHYTPPIYMLITASQQTGTLRPRYEFGRSKVDPYLFPRPVGLEGPVTLDRHNGSPFGRSDITWIDPNLRNSYTFNYSFGVQHALNSTLTFEANYIGNTGRKIYSKYNVNRFSGDLMDNGTLDRINPSFGGIGYTQSNLGSVYNGGTLSLRKRYSHGLLYQVAYTFGKVLDYGSSFSGGAVTPVDPLNWQAQRALADHHRGQKLALSGVWEIPAPANSALSRQLLNGWQLSTIAIFQSGGPYSVNCNDVFRPVRTNGVITGNTGCDWNADGENNDRPMAPSFTAASISGLSQEQYLTGIFTRSQFPSPGLGAIGSLGRNTYFNPGLADVNLSLARTFRIPWVMGTEPANLQLRVDAFNALNLTNLDGVSSNMNAATFGRVTGARDGRRYQLGLRFTF